MTLTNGTTTNGNVPHVYQLPTIDASPQNLNSDLTAVTTKWVDDFNQVLKKQNWSALGQLFHEDSWWKDQLVLSWDLRHIQTISKIEKYLGSNQGKARFGNLKLREQGAYVPKLDSPVDGFYWIEAIFEHENAHGNGTGFLRLIPTGENTWKAYIISTFMKELTGCEEALGYKREYGPNLTTLKRTWGESRQLQKDFTNSQPTVLIVGAGQSGLNLAARLRHLKIPALIVDKNQRIGDNWRNRYRTLVTHDPVQYTHMAYLPFPSEWPMFTPKDKLADWFEGYALLMELNVWMSSKIESAKYDDPSHTWTVEVVRGDGSKRTLTPRHIVWATGHAGEAKVPTFPGQENFKGEVFHSSKYNDATQGGKEDGAAGKRVVVVGTGNSAHDIAQDYCESGAESVTMVQRRGTYVLSRDKAVFMLHAGKHEEESPPTEDADICEYSMPNPIAFRLDQDLTKRIAKVDKDLLEGLEKAGFKIDFGVDGSGIGRRYIEEGGRYYIDVGCSQLIIDGKVKVKHSPDGIKGFTENELVLADGTKLAADTVVLATGYDNMRTTLRAALGDEVADRCKDVWGLDEEGEIKTIWKNSGHPGLWYAGGNLALARFHSRTIALQIKAVEMGIYKQ